MSATRPTRHLPPRDHPAPGRPLRLGPCALLVACIATGTRPAAAQQPGEPPDPATLIHQATQRIELSDYLGARILLDDALDIPGDHAEEATYLVAVSWELGGQAETAIDMYRAMLREWPGGARSQDARFRLAEATATSGDRRRALELLGELTPTPGTDEVKVDLLAATWELELEPTKRAARALGAALDAASPGAVTFYQAKGHVALATRLVALAGGLTFDVRDRKQARRLAERSALILEAEERVTAAAELEEPEWILEGLLQLGNAYEALGADLLAARPRGLSAAQQAEYDAIVAEKVDFIWVKAQRHYARGIEMAQRLRWRSDRIAALEEARARIERRLETSGS